MHFFPTILDAAKTVWVTSLRRTLASYIRNPNARVAISKGTSAVKLLQQNPPVVNCGCLLTCMCVPVLKPNSTTLAGSKLVRSRSQTGSKPNSIMLSGTNRLRTSSEPTSVMEFGFYIARQHHSCTARYRDTDCSQHSVL